MAKYFMPRPIDAPVLPKGAGPNYSCTTEPITPLTDVTVPEGLDRHQGGDRPHGAERQHRRAGRHGLGLAHGVERRAVHRGTAGSEKGNDKVVIVLTDGANTYSVPGHDPAGNKSTYAAYGYLQPGYNGTGVGRLLTGTERRPVQLYERATTPTRSTSTWRRCAIMRRRPTSW